MAIQTTYGVAASAFAGMLADIGTPDIRTGINEEAASVPWGIALAVGTVATSDDYVKLPTVADDLIAGFLIHDHAHDNRASAAGADEALGADKIGNLMRRGYFYAQPEASITVARGDPVYMRLSTSGAKTQKGALSNAIDGVTNVRLPGCRWAQAATNPGFAMIEVIDVGAAGDMVLGDRLVNGSLTADTTVFYMVTPADRWLILEEAICYNPTGLAEDATNFFNIKVQDATPTVYANWSTETGKEGSLAAGANVLALGAVVAIPPGSVLSIFYDEDGTATLPAGEIQIRGRLL